MNQKENVRDYNVGKSNYPKFKIQPWDIWIDWRLNSFDGDIVKRTLRTKEEPGMSPLEARKMDYQKIIHVSLERKRQCDEGIVWQREFVSNRHIYPVDVIDEYKLCFEDANIIREVLKFTEPNYDNIIAACEKRISQIDKELGYDPIINKDI